MGVSGSDQQFVKNVPSGALATLVQITWLAD